MTEAQARKVFKGLSRDSSFPLGARLVLWSLKRQGLRWYAARGLPGRYGIYREPEGRCIWVALEVAERFPEAKVAMGYGFSEGEARSAAFNIDEAGVIDPTIWSDDFSPSGYLGAVLLPYQVEYVSTTTGYRLRGGP